MKFSDKLRECYIAEIEAGWYWDEIEKECYANPQFSSAGDGSVEFSAYLGGVIHLAPSGKYAGPFHLGDTRTVREIVRDTAYWQAFETVAERHGLSITNGDGDPTDIYAVITSFDDYFTRDGENFTDGYGRKIAGSPTELAERMDREGYYPNVFLVSADGYISDHFTMPEPAESR